MRPTGEPAGRVRGRATRLASGRRTMRAAACSAAALIVWGCTGSSATDGDVVARPLSSTPAYVLEFGTRDTAADGRDPDGMCFSELISVPGARLLGASRYLREVGVIEFLDSYIINMPPSAEFISATDLIRSGVAADDFYSEIGASGGAVHLFENRLRQAAGWAIQSVPETGGFQVLHDAFFEVLERCGQDSPWPDVELFEMHDGFGYDLTPGRIEAFGLSSYEYLELRHACARYAATYPTPDPATRDELLGPQREHFARVIVDRLDNELPVVEVPPEYQDEIDDLRVGGW